jgi:hypothetical protein
MGTQAQKGLQEPGPGPGLGEGPREQSGENGSRAACLIVVVGTVAGRALMTQLVSWESKL